MVEIKELIIRANVAPTPVESAPAMRQDSAQNRTREGANEDIIEACVRQVLAILKRQKER